MSILQINCFQSFTVRHNQQPVIFRSVKGRALLAYLAVEQQQRHQRSTLAGLLWPDEAEARARRNLTQTLLEVRKAIGDADATPPFLQITSATIAFNPQSDYALDVLAFTNALANNDYAQAAALYRGPFLADLAVAESDLFERWLETTREQLHQQACDALAKVCAEQESQGEIESALQSARRWLALAPWQEEAHCQLMRLLARNGQRSAALAQYDTLTAYLMDELGVPPASATDELYDQILAGELAPVSMQRVQPAPSTPPAPIDPPFQALAQPAHFVGRQREIDKLHSQMCAPGLQIHAIVGMGGAGKTTLATQVAHVARADFPDGVLWASARTSKVLDVLASWASAYGYDYSQLNDLESRAAAVRGLLAERKTLLIIDNVQQVSDVEPLLPNGGDCAVLFTTRDLDVATALNAEPVLLGELAAQEALDLLRQILDPRRVEQEETAAIELCRLCGELPLAVEIAAQRLKSRPRMKLAQMVTRLGDQQRRLDLGISDRAVRASFAVSWDALDQELQQLFPMLAVFGGQPFTPEAVTYLANGDQFDGEQFDVEDQLFALEALSLVRGVDGARYQLHPLLTDFAREKLKDADTIYHRLVDYYYEFGQANRAKRDLLQPEWANLLAAITVAHQLERWQLVIDYTTALTQPWFADARYSDARSAYALANDAAEQLHDEEALATNLTRWGHACVEQNDYDDAQRYLTESLQHYLVEEQEEGIAQTKFLLARIAIERNQFDEAEALFKECLFVYEYHNDQQAIAAIRSCQGDIQYTLKNYAAAQKLAEEALHLQELGDNPKEMIPTLRLLAQIAAQNQAYDRAHHYCKQATALSEMHGFQEEIAITLYTQSFIYRSHHAFEEAAGAVQQALPLLEKLGLQRISAMARYQLGIALKELGHFQAAREPIQQSIEIFHHLNDELGIAYSLIVSGDLYRATNQIPEARAAWLEAQTVGQAYPQSGIRDQTAQRLAAAKADHGSRLSDAY